MPSSDSPHLLTGRVSESKMWTFIFYSDWLFHQRGKIFRDLDWTVRVCAKHTLRSLFPSKVSFQGKLRGGFIRLFPQFHYRNSRIRCMCTQVWIACPHALLETARRLWTAHSLPTRPLLLTRCACFTEISCMENDALCTGRASQSYRNAFLPESKRCYCAGVMKCVRETLVSL